MAVGIPRAVCVLKLLGAGGALIMLSSAGSAQEGALSRCLLIPDIVKRVECYDAIARAQAGAEAQAAPLARPAPEQRTPQVPPPTPAIEQRAEFGLSAAERELRLPTEQRQLEEVSTVVAVARIVGAGYWEFEMRDGSLWRLAETRRSFRPPRVGDAIQLRRGSLGSYFLEAEGQAGIRVKRVS